MPLFVLFWVDFHSARLFFAYYGVFLYNVGQFLGWGEVGDEHGSIFSFCTFCIFAFLTFFGCFWALFGFQWRFGHFESISELRGN